MDKNTAQKISYDLTLEFFRQNEILKCPKEKIDDKVKFMAEVQNIFYNSLINNRDFI